MLAQNFKTADELGLSDKEKDALSKTLVLLETGKVQHVAFDNDWDLSDYETFTGHFNMATWGRVAPCGTVQCIGGTADVIGGVSLATVATKNPALKDLFEPTAIHWSEWEDITVEQAATALRSYLTTGDARWELAVTSCSGN